MVQKVFILLPAYNEAANIGSLLERVDRAMRDAGISYAVILVDDGSADETFSIASALGRTMPITIHRHDVNMGLGPTIGDAFLLATSVMGPDDIAVVMDADDTHDPRVIPEMAAAIHRGADVVIASRYARGSTVQGVPRERLWLSNGASALFRLVFPTPGVRDYTSGFRAYRGRILQSAFAHYQESFVDQVGFQCMADILLKLRHIGARFDEVPFALRYDMKRGASKMKVLQTVTRTLGLVMRRRLIAFREAR